MNKKLFYLTTTLLLFILQQVNAQNGKADIKLELHEVDCDNMTMSMDIFIKANDVNSTFGLAEQNYRMSFSRAVYNPVIIEEFLSGAIPLSDSIYAFYYGHTLEGTIDTIISYNVSADEVTPGVMLNEYEWLPIGRMGFDIADIEGCVNIVVHDETIYPSTVIVEQYDNGLYPVDSGNFTGLAACFGSICSDLPLPLVAEDDHVTVPANQIITHNVLENDYAWENGLDSSSFHLISTPPASQMTVTAGANPGEITLHPVQGFIGDIAPFEYRICNTGNQCVEAKVFATVTPSTSTTNPDAENDIRLFPTAAKDYINVEYLNMQSNEKTQIVITDINGRIVLQTNERMAGNTIHQFDIGTLTQGVYLLGTMMEGEWTTRKFVKM